MPYNVICKVCTSCKETKQLDAFYFLKNGPQQRTTRCKKCHLLANKQSQIKNGHKWKKARGSLSNRLRLAREWRKRNLAYDAARQRKRKAQQLNAVPKWADLSKIKDLYREAHQKQLQVDHIVPLTHPLVCGLHCEDNLQLLLGCDNQAKGNRYWKDMPCHIG